MLRHLSERGAGGPRIGKLTLYGRRRAWLTFLVAVNIAAIFLASAWWNETSFDWLFLIGAALVVLISGLELAFSAKASPPMRIAEESDALRNALLAGDDLSAPVVTQPPALVHDIPALTAGPLDDISARDQRNQTARGGFSYFNMAAWVFPLYFLMAFHVWQFLPLGAYSIFTGIFYLARYGRANRPLTISADARGLSWRRGLLRHNVPWREVRALARIVIPAGRDIQFNPSPSRTAYLLVGRKESLIWSTWPPRAKTSRRAFRRARAVDPALGGPLGDPAERLCAFILSRTGQPLRDLTPAIANFAATLKRPSRAPMLREDGAAVLAARYAVPPRPASPLRWVALALVISVIASALTVWIGEPHIYNSQLALARSSQPLFADALARPSAQWPEGDYPGGTYTYSDGAYQLTRNDNGDTCCAVFAWTPATFGDAMLEVTERQTGDFDLAESGLVLRADDQTHDMLVFTVSLNGEWKVERIYATDDGSGTTNENELAYHGTLLPERAIHQGSGASNRLAVLMRGTSYAFFINDSFVGAYHDAGPKRGHVGIYTDGLSDSAAFSDFAVYPAPPPTPLLPV